MEPPWKSRLEEIDAVPIVGQLAFHGRHQVIDIGIGLDGFMGRHPDRSAPADAADVVAQQIDDHGEFGVVFGAGFQFLPHGVVFAGVAPAGARALDGAGLNMTVVQPQEALRGSGDQMMVAGVHEREKRGRILLVQGPEKAEGTPLEPCLKPLGEIHLVDIPRRDVVPNTLDRRFIIRSVEIGLQPALVHRKTFIRHGGLPKRRHPIFAIRPQLSVPHATHDFMQAGLLPLLVVNKDHRWGIEAQMRQLPAVHRRTGEIFKNVFQVVGQIAHESGGQRRRGPGVRTTVIVVHDGPHGLPGIQRQGVCLVVHGEQQVMAPTLKGKPGIEAQDMIAGTFQVAAAEQQDRALLGGHAGRQIEEGAVQGRSPVCGCFRSARRLLEFDGWRWSCRLVGV